MVKRNNLTDIPPPETHFALGQANPLIISHPEDTTVCEGAYPSFSVTVSGNETDYTYAWYKDGVPIPGGDPHYSGRLTATLTINGAELTDAGTYYCIVRDRFLRTTTSHSATLIVNKIPKAIVSIEKQDHECSDVPFDNIVLGLSEFVPGTTFVWTRTTHDGIETSIPESGTALSIGDALSGSFNNFTNEPITITFEITPVGAAPTMCTGQCVTSTVTVNPKPQINPVTSEICYGGNTEIKLVSETIFTMPIEDILQFGYRAYTTSSSVGGFAGTQPNAAYGTVIRNPYSNGSDTLQSVFYNIVPYFTSTLAGCLAGDSVSFETKIHAQPLQDIIITQPLLCDGGSNAEMEAITSVGAGGTEGYYFEWVRNSTLQANGNNLNELTGIRGGLWTVTVTDNLNCSNMKTMTVSGSKLDPVMRVQRNDLGYATSCPGSADGEIQIGEFGLTSVAPFEYWIVKEEEDIASASFHGFISHKGLPYTQITGVSPGMYYLHIIDANGCSTDIVPVEYVNDPPEIEVTFESKKYEGGFDVSCKGYDNGEVWVSKISGGNGVFSFKWSTTIGGAAIETSDKLENIPAGKYYLTVTDFHGCEKLDSVIITEPDGMSLVSYELSVKTDGVYNVSCHDGDDGYINIEIEGGSGVFTYSWTGPNGFTSTQKNITGLEAGDYRCTVTDLNDCQLITPIFTLYEPPNITIATTLSVISGYNIGCYGGTGSVQVMATGGIDLGAGGYQYTWSTENGSGIVQGQKDQPALTAGTYLLTVKDINGCVKSIDITLTQPDAITLQFTTKHITCATSVFNDGAVSLTVSGGVAPYSYLWSNGATTKDISDLTEGNYTVTVTDANGCTATSVVTVVNPPLLTYTSQVSNYNGFNVSCFDMSNGYININITGGTAPYLFSWTGPDGFIAYTQSISGLKAGTYTVHIADSLGCTANQVFNLSEPNKLGMNIDVSKSRDGLYNLNCAGDRTGYIDINPVNGVGTVEYLWSDGLYGKTRNNLPAGRYSIIITDANGCYDNTSVTLTEPEPIKINFIVDKPFCPDMTDGAVTAEVNGGISANYLYRWYDNSTNSSLRNINTGWYPLEVEDLNGCIAKDSVKVEPLNRSCLVIPNAISPNGDLINDVWNIGNIHLYPEAEVKIFNRWGVSVWTSEKGYPRPWDGTREGRDLPVDSYHYIIDLHNGDRPMIGTITIVK